MKIQIIDKIFNWQEEQAVNARVLWEKLEVKKDFTDWLKDQVDWLELENGLDYIPLWGGIGQLSQPKVRHEFALSLDCAKYIAISSKTEQWKYIRKYFIEIEKLYRHKLQKEIKQLKQSPKYKQDQWKIFWNNLELFARRISN